MRNSRRPSDADVDPDQDPLSPYSSPTVRRSAGGGTEPLDDMSSGTPAPIEIAPTTAAPASTGTFVVTNTGSEGLFLRADPSATGNTLATLPEGTKVEALGQEQSDGTRTWKKVKGPDGQEGWVAADFLVAAP